MVRRWPGSWVRPHAYGRPCSVCNWITRRSVRAHSIRSPFRDRMHKSANGAKPSWRMAGLGRKRRVSFEEATPAEADRFLPTFRMCRAQQGPSRVFGPANLRRAPRRWSAHLRTGKTTSCPITHRSARRDRIVESAVCDSVASKRTERESLRNPDKSRGSPSPRVVRKICRDPHVRCRVPRAKLVLSSPHAGSSTTQLCHG